MSDLILGIGEYGVSKTPGSMVKTYALGSCVAVTMYEPNLKIAGMVHVALPESKLNTAKGEQCPGYFADLGVPLLFKEMVRLGCHARGRGLVVKMLGGAAVMAGNDTFNIGKRNILAVKKILWKLGMGPVAEDVGANYSRTVSLHVDTGLVNVSCPGRGQWQI
ncbi:protein glutamine deamidase and protein glutamate methylesterase CheD associated with MCPs of class 36H [Syntrophotalea carbinolica DSM 2380]|uniref:Probable chemoreceptor glutamine deamidase CheD n=1 Tax=Syntrophotalea carbinolica (strain DSM 2380 / NBRC 103641 / GraBd1) TaxID=338963 RepID=CHED_SYNC1|nr:chemotaxis protein CheD [Syntrophotalea carbinolica]Q3A5A7.1 RecName: Full=Probable chemoreceptor glutamine deamidase CheD [Syntrophotalea carbinolica DSM 2380]ABA88450.1 protein glutamine deamidase and protein glutamate methylesterase CheD associated with MCPs of class 36H [Syntrophotalea carbinolica DSM 2380]